MSSPTMTQRTSTQPTVTANDLSRRFGDFVAVDRVSFEVSAGEIFGFLGSNGAGKTTTIRMLCGLLTPTSGAGTVAGFDIASQSADIKANIGYMSQRFSLYTDLTVDENITFWGAAYGIVGRPMRQRREWAIHTTGLEERRRTLVRSLPGGFRQRLALVCALLHEPPVVFLDEPTGGVDPEARRQFWDLIDELTAAGTTVFVTTHYMDEAERCHRVALMHAGRLLALDSVPNLKRQITTGVVLEIRCQRAAQALAPILSMKAVRDTALFGNRLHAEVDNASTADLIVRELEAGGFGPINIKEVPPSLENVFISAIRLAEAEAAA